MRQDLVHLADVSRMGGRGIVAGEPAAGRTPAPDRPAARLRPRIAPRSPSCITPGLPRQIVERGHECREAPGQAFSVDKILGRWPRRQRRGFRDARNEDARGGMSRHKAGARGPEMARRVEEGEGEAPRGARRPLPHASHRPLGRVAGLARPSDPPHAGEDRGEVGGRHCDGDAEAAEQRVDGFGLRLCLARRRRQRGGAGSTARPRAAAMTRRRAADSAGRRIFRMAHQRMRGMVLRGPPSAGTSG